MEERPWESLVDQTTTARNLEPDWIEPFLSDRQNKELNWCLLYENFKHGTDGHNRLLLVAMLYSIVDAAWRLLTNEQRDKVRRIVEIRKSDGQSP